MRVALITDTHWGARNDSIHFIEFYEKFYRDTFFPTLKKEKITHVIMLGDTFDRRKYINFVTWKKARDIYFDVLYSMGITATILVGNHDTSYKNTNEVNSPNLLLQEYKNLNIISTPQTLNIGGTDICFIPWICSDNEQSCMDEINNTNAEICMGHFEIDGFSMYRGITSEGGLSRGTFNKFVHTFSGHYHHKSNAGNIHYIGNPYELTWSDYNDPRGFHIYDLDSKQLNFIKNPNTIFHRIEYDDINTSEEDFKKIDLSKYTNTFVKVVVQNKTNPYFFDKFVGKLYKVNPIEVNIAEDFTEIIEEFEDVGVDQAEDTLSIINKYIDSVKNESIDNTKLKSVVREIYNETLNQEEK